MDQNPQDRIDRLLERASDQFPFPHTPDLARGLRHGPEILGKTRLRRSWALAVLLLACLASVAVTPVRAAIVEIIQIGAVRIFPDLAEIRNSERLDNLEPIAVRTGFLDALDGETSIASAAELAGFPLLIPGPASRVGPPDHVFYQDLGGPAVALFWVSGEDSSQIRLSLIQLGAGAFIGKHAPDSVQEVTVRGNDGIWLEGQHQLFLNANGMNEIPIDGNVLIWEEDGITYRLEINAPFEQALSIAEFLQPAEN